MASSASLSASSYQNYNTIKNSEAIFMGSNYHDWQARLFAAIAKEDAKLATLPNAVEEQYRATTLVLRFTQYSVYDKIQDKAKGAFFERLQD